MPNENFFTRLGEFSFYKNEVKIQSTEEDNYSKSEEHIQFDIDPKNFFQTNGEESVELVPQFLNENLIKRDPHSFIYGYNQLLKVICFCEDKEIPLSTLYKIIISSNGTRDMTTQFILDTGLAYRTQRVFNILNMQEEWDTLNKVLEGNPIEKISN
jgi:hypothetical protein